MINSTYKLFTRLIMRRIINSLNRCIERHQSEFMFMRSIFDNIKKTQILINKTDQLKTSLYVTLLDQKKAYDQVNHKYLWNCLRKIDVLLIIIKTIQKCYDEARFRMFVNKFLSENFKIEREVRQKDSLFCILYNVIIESLTLHIIKNSELSDFKNETKHVHKISMYADDIAMYFTFLRQWKAFKRSFELYKSVCEFNLNEFKCEIITIEVKSAFENLRIIKIIDRILSKYLNISIDNKLKNKKIWLKLLKKIKRIIIRWNLKYLFMRQRISVIKRCLNNILYFYLRCLSATQDDLKFIEKTINEYMWKSKDNRSATSIILNQTIESIAKRELNVINLKIMKQTLSLYWIFKLKEIVSKIKQSIWVQIIKDIISHDYSKDTKQKLIESWKQMWSVRSHQLSSSVNHF
jgi:hypothetical protein